MTEPEQNQPKPSRLKRKKYLIYSCFFLVLIGFGLFFRNELTPEKETVTTDVSTQDVTEEVPELTRDVYFLGSAFDLAGDYPVIELSEAPQVKAPSFFLVDYENIDPRFDRIYHDLVADKHAVIFIGKEIDAEKVVPFFSEFEIPVVPIDGTFPTSFQAYGAMYSVEAADEIPVFYATNNLDTFDQNSFIKTLSSLEKHLSK